MGSYRVNEIFYSIQGEGAQTGIPYVFLRLSGCNLSCSRDVEGFDCDTEFVSGKDMSTEEILEALSALRGGAVPPGSWVCLTGGEPSLQIDDELITDLHDAGWKIAIETNGTNKLPDGIDYVACSPKTAEHTLRVGDVDELRYVRNLNQQIPRPALKAKTLCISPACAPTGRYDSRVVDHCIQLVKDNPGWRLSLQTHKLLAVR